MVCEGRGRERRCVVCEGRGGNMCKQGRKEEGRGRGGVRCVKGEEGRCVVCE